MIRTTQYCVGTVFWLRGGENCIHRNGNQNSTFSFIHRIAGIPLSRDYTALKHLHPIYHTQERSRSTISGMCEEFGWRQFRWVSLGLFPTWKIPQPVKFSREWTHPTKNEQIGVILLGRLHGLGSFICRKQTTRNPNIVIYSFWSNYSQYTLYLLCH